MITLAHAQFDQKTLDNIENDLKVIDGLYDAFMAEHPRIEPINEQECALYGRVESLIEELRNATYQYSEFLRENTMRTE